MVRKPQGLLEAAINDLVAGRSQVLDLQDINVPLDMLTERHRTIPGLRELILPRSSSPVQLPGWLVDLPALERVDATLTSIDTIPEQQHLRWAIRAEELPRYRNGPGLQNIYGMTVEPRTPAEAVHELAAMCRAGELDLDRLKFDAEGVKRDAAPDEVAGNWNALDALDSVVDGILDSQPALQSFSMFACPLKRVPEPLRRMTSLAALTLSAVFPATLPEWVLGLANLHTVKLWFNGFTRLPQSVEGGRNLRHLSLDGNPLTSLPSWLWTFTDLETLSLRDCPIEEIPPEVLRLKNLTTLNLEPLPWMKPTASTVQVPPPEVVAGGIEAIRRYWRQQEAVGVDHLAEAKLLIVGEAGAGKTTLAEKIIDPNYVLRTGEPSTEGIDVRPWRFPGAVRVRQDNSERVLQRAIRINIWDFGGQEIYHSTHQFFLTKRSVYVLVTDERKEDADFEYWLEIVDLLSDGSPVLIVQNRKQGRGQGIDLGAIRQRYPNMRGALEVDLADNSGLTAAVATIRRELEQLPHLGTPLPATWREVRLALEADPRDHISVEEFFALCAEKGFTRDDDMRQLGGYLHDLGICLFFQDDALLRKTVVLKPEWGTTAVYRVLDDPDIAAATGVFSSDDLERIWHEPRFAPMGPELLRLMERFGLCYPVPGSTTWIAPQLLSPAQPAYAWPDDGNVVLRYEYDVMPKGIVRRLIVSLHNRLVPGDHVWRNGGLFVYGATRAEVVEDYRRRHLHVRLRGEDPRALLAIIDQALTVIHASYPRIRFRTFLPCACATCADVREPAMFPRDELEDFARTGDLIQCRSSRKMVDPLALLRALSTDADRRVQAATIRADAGPVVPSQPEVFVSYKWGGPGDAFVNELQAYLADRGVPLVRDKNAMRYRDSIREFMRRLGAGKYVVVVLDDGYLRSDDCMFELTEIAKDPAFASRVFPVIMSDAAIFKARQRLGYVKYWESEIRELDAELKDVGPKNLQGIHDERNLYETIRNTIAGIVDVLADMNALIPDQHRDTDFDQLYQALDAALSAGRGQQQHR